MRYLAKLGFTQSYTYFTWRNTKAELTRVLHRADADRACASTCGRTCSPTRPTSCTSTCSAAAGRRSRCGCVLAATLGASYGIYSGFELSRERAGHGRAARSTWTRRSTRSGRATASSRAASRSSSRRVNAIRREHPALQHDWRPARSTRPTTPSSSATASGRSTAATSMLVVVNLDPFHMQHGFVQLPLDGLGPRRRTQPIEVVDLLVGRALLLARRVELRAARSAEPRRAHPARDRCTHAAP